MRFQDLASAFGLGCANGSAALRTGIGDVAIAFAPIEVQQSDIMAKRHIAGDGAGAAALGVARMTAGDNDLKTRCCGVRQR